MSADEFWHGEYELAGAYREAEMIRRDNRAIGQWENGVYIIEAMLTAAPAFREWSRGSRHEYPDEPLFLAHKEQSEHDAMMKAKAEFEAFAIAFNMNMKQGE